MADRGSKPPFAKMTEVMVNITAYSADAEIALKHASEAAGALGFRMWKVKYEEAGAPYGLSMAGFKEWLVEQGKADLVASWEAADA